MESSESRERLMLQATRLALISAARRARYAIPVGVVVAAGGGSLAYGMWSTGALGLIASVFVALIGLVMVPVGIAVIARAVATIGNSRRRLRELDALAIPRARVVR